MSKNFFVPKNIYKKRIAVCKSCVYYFKPTGTCKMCGCFMKVKARISQMDCPKLYWKSNSFDFEQTKKLPEVPTEIVNEVMLLWPYIKTGRATTIKKKKLLIELYNTIYGGNFSGSTSCGSCLNTCFNGLKKIYDDNTAYHKEI
tara:strand:- start:1364 stop:1795 length:432 start_codon:yes stop_codon:yes gene_type:complete